MATVIVKNSLFFILKTLRKYIIRDNCDNSLHNIYIYIEREIERERKKIKSSKFQIGKEGKIKY